MLYPYAVRHRTRLIGQGRRLARASPDPLTSLPASRCTGGSSCRPCSSIETELSAGGHGQRHHECRQRPPRGQSGLARRGDSAHRHRAPQRTPHRWQMGTPQPLGRDPCPGNVPRSRCHRAWCWNSPRRAGSVSGPCPARRAASQRRARARRSPPAPHRPMRRRRHRDKPRACTVQPAHAATIGSSRQGSGRWLACLASCASRAARQCLAHASVFPQVSPCFSAATQARGRAQNRRSSRNPTARP